MSNKKVSVLIVDDSAVVRAVLKQVLEAHPAISVCGAAVDPYEARDMIKKLNPDVLTLDIEMPKMNGIAFLKNLMRLRPMPVVMISTLTQEGAPATLEALEHGAIDFLPKPQNEGADGLALYAEEICEKVIAASKANLQVKLNSGEKKKAKPSPSALKLSKKKPNYLCAIGASTGGTEAIKDVITMLPAECPPIVITQHIPPGFSASFAKRVDRLSEVKVFEASDGQAIEPGCVYIAPGDAHLIIKKEFNGLRCKLDYSAPINRHRPSVDPMFDSVVSAVGNSGQGIILTGMGSDGAEGLLRMRQAGFPTVAQSESTCVVWGMPRAAVKIDAADKVLDLDRIPKEILRSYYS